MALNPHGFSAGLTPDIPTRPSLPRKELMKGHPTAPGRPDHDEVVRRGVADRDGVPNFPYVRPSPEGHGHGAPGTIPGPFQPSPEHDGPDDL